jgi:hypothetical protein
MKNQPQIKWLKKPQEHDFPAALSYLTLIYEPEEAQHLTNRLKKSAVVFFKAKDIFRASGLSLLGVSNLHVQKDRKKIKKEIALSPILLVRDTQNRKVIIADGYHRLCAVYSVDEDAVIPCVIC